MIRRQLPRTFHLPRMASLLILAILAGFTSSLQAEKLPAVNATEEDAGTDPTAISFEHDIQPLLRRHCYRCHGEKASEGGIRLSQKESALGTGDSEMPLVVAGKPDESYLLTRLTDDSWGEVMPLDAEPLSKDEIALLRTWIDQGAKWPESLATDRHWAYTKPTKHEPPQVQKKSWIQNPIDNFVLSRLEEEGLKPSPQADKARLIRRASLSLTGLPPSVEEVEAFLQDDSPDAYEKVVDRLLKSKHFGERWARHWLDLARYADSNGYQADQLRDIWAYRDWVIRAFNEDLPYDEFTIEQLAGDLLPNATAPQKIATGFHRTTTCNVEAGVHPEENRVNQVFDRVNTTGTVFLGTTMECAQCHDHKYDPFSQKEYYQLFAYFNNTPLEVKQDAGVQYDFVGPSMMLPLSEEQLTTYETLSLKKEKLEKVLEQKKTSQMKNYAKWREEVTAALKTNPAAWEAKKPESFQSNGGESHKILKDDSVLISGSLPDTSIYEVRFPGPLKSVLGFKLEALTHPDLPGTGPGRGDEERPNFVLNEFTVKVENEKGMAEPVELFSAEADFSQRKYDISQAIDGNRRTAWAIGPQFFKPHWATFRTEEPFEIAEGETLVIQLDQNFGRGRTIGRFRLSFLQGSPMTAGISEEVSKLLVKKKKLSTKQENQVKKFYQNSNPELRDLFVEQTQLQREMDAIQPPTTLVMVEMEECRSTQVLNRGNYLDKGDEVQPDTPSILHSLDSDLPKNRLGLAKWLTSPDNPLIARVAVNRWWAEIFGQGIVRTPEDFGTQSEPPTHPELLDWLAVDFMENDWSLKALLKKIVMSSTFQQSSQVTPQKLRLDPENRLLSRGPRFRLPAEAIRDNALVISGLFSDEMYGPPIMPYQPDGIWKALGRNQPKWVTAIDNDRFRRGVYIVWKRAAPYPSLINFDAPDRASCTVQRPRTNTPLQALTLLNDPVYAEMALALAQRMMREAPEETQESRIIRGFQLCVARKPTAQEMEILKQVFANERQKLAKNPELVKQRIQNLLPRLRDPDLSEEELAAWFIVANVLLNLDEAMNL
ncbi:Planctomycete cytochrome C [Planctomycetales bacterium 10988]|nr:Planctomycete cytochrome C [Planctomycetales bacterium 10988]